jgi:hypothetical protein
MYTENPYAQDMFPCLKATTHTHNNTEEKMTEVVSYEQMK